MKKFIMYGAGNIGRGFIGQVFSNNGYKVGFVDINKEVIAKLNQDKCYPVDVVSNDGVVEQIVENVYGIDGTDLELVSNEIAEADIMATAIGVNVLKFIAKPISLGLKKRFERSKKPFNIIICENLIGADEFLRNLIIEQIPEYKDRILSEIGFVEASIGRMVPVVPEEKKKENFLRVFVEPYNILPVDKDAFKGEIPEISNLYPYSPFNLFIQRKLFMHNMSHALCAYLGKLRGYEYIYQAVGDYDIKMVAYKALVQSAEAVAKENGVEIFDLLAHAENLLYRFSNVALGDTVARVGRDTKRKLSSNDRLIGAIKLADKFDIPNHYLCLGVAAGMHFSFDDDANSIEVKEFAKTNGAKETLLKYCDYSGKMTDLICSLYQKIADGEKVETLIKYCEDLIGSKIRA
ncbi:MAG: mannitol dehydrogenase [Clostridia bacterium]|nr:mannitol dehydrogenase [Clostridia bacterium]